MTTPAMVLRKYLNRTDDLTPAERRTLRLMVLALLRRRRILAHHLHRTRLWRLL